MLRYPRAWLRLRLMRYTAKTITTSPAKTHPTAMGTASDISNSQSSAKQKKKSIIVLDIYFVFTINQLLVLEASNESNIFFFNN